MVYSFISVDDEMGMVYVNQMVEDIDEDGIVKEEVYCLIESVVL